MVQHYRPLSGLSGTERLTHSIKNLIVSGLGEKYFTTFLQVISPLLPTKTRKIWKRGFQPLCRNSFLQSIKGTECQQNTAAALPTAVSETWLPGDFPLLIIDELKSWILTKAYRTSLLACAFCVQCLQLTAKLCDPIPRSNTFSPQSVLRLSIQPTTNLAYSSASLGIFYKVKTTILLFRPHLDIPVGAYLCAPGFWFLRSKLGSG